MEVWGQGGEMTQTLQVHMNIIKKGKKGNEEKKT
jgi:hypothetical protein